MRAEFSLRAIWLLARGPASCYWKEANLNHFLWIAQQGLQDARAEAANGVGMCNYKSDPPQLRVKTIDHVYKDKPLV